MCSNRPHVILIVHGHNDAISLADVSELPRGRIAIQSDFLPVLPLHEIVAAFNAQHFALDPVVNLQLLSRSVYTHLTGFPPRWICRNTLPGGREDLASSLGRADVYQASRGNV